MYRPTESNEQAFPLTMFPYSKMSSSLSMCSSHIFYSKSAVFYCRAPIREIVPCSCDTQADARAGNWRVSGHYWSANGINVSFISFLFFHGVFFLLLFLVMGQLAAWKGKSGLVHCLALRFWCQVASNSSHFELTRTASEGVLRKKDDCPSL